MNFSCFTGEPKAHEELFRKVLKISGTGFPACADRLAGAEPRHTPFSALQVDQRPINNNNKKFLVAPASCRYGAQAGSLCYQKWRAGTPAPLVIIYGWAEGP